MRVILSVDALTPQLSGIGRYTWELATRLPQSDSIDKIRYYRAGHWINNPADLLDETKAVKRRKWKIPRRLRDLYWQHACRGQVFHGPNFFLPPCAENGVVTVHDLSVFKFPETHPAERVHQFEKSFSKTLNTAAHLITDSETTRQEIIEIFNWPSERLTAVHLGVSSRFAPKSAGELFLLLQHYKLSYGTYTLCVSTIEPRKRIDKLLLAYSRLPTDLRAANPLILIGGQGWHSEHLHDMISAGQNAGWLHYFGYVPEVDLPKLYAGARLFVYPSIYEGFGLPIVEAMASGIPVIASNCSCLPEIAAGAAKLVDPDDVDKFSAEIEEALQDISWRRQSAARGLLIAARYNWDECIRRTVAVYKKV